MRLKYIQICNFTYILIYSYKFGLSKKHDVDASQYGNEARYINRSCDPNAICYLWYLAEGLEVIGIYALRDIQAETEISIDYGWDSREGNFCSYQYEH